MENKVKKFKGKSTFFLPVSFNSKSSLTKKTPSLIEFSISTQPDEAFKKTATFFDPKLASPLTDDGLRPISNPQIRNRSSKNHQSTCYFLPVFVIFKFSS